MVVPSRERPAQALALARAFNHTAVTRPGLVFAVAEDDPTLPEYRQMAVLTTGFGLAIQAVPPVDRPSTMTHALNAVAVWLANADGGPYAVGFMGDDHRPRTYGWDRMYLDALRDMGTGIAYGDDLLQGECLPTQVAMTSDIIRTLSFMAPPNLWHMFCDDFWRDLGRAAGCLRYMPEVVVEHLHPLAGKAPVDETYTLSNRPAVYEHDATIYGRYHLSGQFAADVLKVQALREQPEATDGTR
jgi:hypothetical protein